MTHRGRIQQIVDLMSAIKKFPNYAQYRVSTIAGLRLNKGYYLFSYLEEAGFITRKKQENGYCLRLTDEGVDWYLSMQKLLTRLNNSHNNK